MPSSTADKSRILEQVDGQIAGALGVACALVLVAKAWLVTRININWDEFYFLSEIHALARGELHSSFQTAYTRLFGWLTDLGVHEVARINIARFGMLVLLAVTAGMLYRLARRWYAAPASALGVLAFLGLWVTLRHGASFRIDALLLPLQVAALLALTNPAWTLGRRSRRAGALLGIAGVLSVKAVLLAPVVAAMLLLPRVVRDEPIRTLAQRLIAGVVVALVATLIAVLMLSAHHFALADAIAPVAPTGLEEQSVTERAGDAWRRTIAEAEFMPRAAVLREQVQTDPLFWLLATAGLAVAVAHRHWGSAACALAILPVFFYRNSFAYYYVVMLAPLAVLVAAGADFVFTSIRRAAPNHVAPWVAVGLTLSLALAAQTIAHGLQLSAPRQDQQKRLVAGVHAMFPNPVPYIDHSGMISSFPKANLFMTNWGMERYAKAGKGFAREALTRRRAPLLLENRAELRIGTPAFGLLLPEDRALIKHFYLPYWGPVRVAGVHQMITAGVAQRVELPFHGDWRLRSPYSVTVDGRRIAPGDVFAVGAARDRTAATDGFPSVEVAVPPDQPVPHAAFSVIWAGARPPPPGPEPRPIRYDPL